MSGIIEYILSFTSFNSIIGLALYWAPLGLCAFGYTLRSFREMRNDVHNRDAALYAPKILIGDLVGRAIVSVIPIANLWAALFDVSPRLFKKFFEGVSAVLDQPLVPKRKK